MIILASRGSIMLTRIMLNLYAKVYSEPLNFESKMQFGLNVFSLRQKVG